jgi:hypothetical protein
MRRLRLSRRHVVLALGVIALLVAAAGVLARTGHSSQKTLVRTQIERLAVTRAVGAPPGLFVTAGHVRGSRAQALAGKAYSPLSGWVSPVAVPTPDGRSLVYTTWRELRHDNPGLGWAKQGIKPGDALGTPSLRIHDLATGSDSVIDTGSYSAAVRSDGAIAYVRGIDPNYRAFADFAGSLVVRDSPSTAASVWSTTPDAYVAAAWAGNTLLAYRISEGERLDLLAFDGPGRERLLMPNGNLVAVSPDGRQVFVGNDTNVPGFVSVLNVADGSTAATLDLSSTGTNVLWASYGGSWSGDSIAARTNAGIAIFRVSGGSIALEQLLQVDRSAFPNGAIEPQFVGGTGRIVARGEGAPGLITGADEDSTATLDCDLAAASCAAGAPEPGRDWLHPVYNPSRPLKGGQ